MRSLLLLSASFLFALALFAQSDRGTITGTIADPAGAVVAGAKVEAKNIATGAVYQVASTDTGNYTLSQLPAGGYEMSITVSGFKKFVRQNITVQVAGTLRIDAVLEVGATTESVTVTSEVSLLKTESGELSHNVSTERLDNLPAITLGASGTLGNIRNPLQVVTLLPGTQFATDNTLRVNGLPSSTYSIRVEGQDASNGITRQTTQVNQAGLDAIQEVSVQVSNYAAEFGQAGGGYFNYTMKSGTNQFHGSAYDYFVNEALNSPVPFTNDGTGHHFLNRQRRNDYGFTFGGPIAIPKVYNGHEKTFFFFNFEQFRETLRVTTGLQTVPTLAYRDGNFSGAQLNRLTIAGQPATDSLGNAVFQNAIYDPKTQRVAPDGSTVRLQYPGNLIPKTDFDPVAVKIQDLIPAPRGTRANEAITNYEAPAYDNLRHTTIPSLKLDHNLSSTIKVSGYYAETRAFSPQVNDFQQIFTNSVIQDSVSRTVRVNYDQSLTPTMLLHLGAGLLHTSQPNVTPAFDQSSLGWSKNFAAPTLFPYTSIGSDASKGGLPYIMGIFNPYAYIKDIKPTGNTNLTWVKGNHTYKMGGEVLFEGFPNLSYSRANGNYSYAAQQSGNPWENGRGTNAFTGFSYASFLLGRSSSLNLGTGSNNRIGNHSLGLYFQDTWKVTRKFTLDYGLRYDYASLLKEQYGRMQDAAFNTPNPVAGNRLGSVIYEATCNCSFNHNYKFALGPRLGAAYQITPKTVFRAGVGVSYGTVNQSTFSPNVGDFYTVNPVGYGEPATLLRDGNPYGAGNRFGNAPIFWPDFRPNYPSEVSPGVRPPQSPFVSIDPNGGRPPRIFQWSIGLQREIAPNLVVEAAYVGNRGVWWTAPLLAGQNYNPLTVDGLKALGIDTSIAADRTLLTTPISSPAVIARFPNLANPNNVYPGFPGGQTLSQALRPYPQWGGIPPFLGPPLGVTWYDSLQAKVTKRVSRGLSVDSAFSWQKELSLGVASDTTYLTPAPTLINDVLNRNQNKQISAFSRPFILVITANYTTPGFAANSTAFRALSWVVRDWTLGTLLRYQSGQVIRTPPSSNGFFTQIRRTENPATFGGGNTFFNRVPGVNPLLFDPNCKCFDPTTQLVLNPAAWTDAPAGTFGTAAPYYNDYRWQRQPAESVSIGRNFRLAKEGRVALSVRAEFQNMFNRVFLTNPLGVAASSSPFVVGAGAPNPLSPTVRNSVGALSSGYGFVNTFNGAGTQPRTGQIVARFSF